MPALVVPPLTFRVDDRRVIASIDHLTPAIKDAVRPVIKELTATMLAEVQAAEPYRTGRLRAHTRASVIEGDQYIRGRVRIEGAPSQDRLYAIAASLEYGVHRVIEVGAYQRRGASVRGYRRIENMAGRRFLRNSAEAIQQTAIDAIEAAIASAIQKGA